MPELTIYFRKIVRCAETNCGHIEYNYFHDVSRNPTLILQVEDFKYFSV